MAGVFKRKSSDEKKRKRPPKWTCWWIDEDGKTRQKVGTTDRVASLEIARKKEAECRLIREGLLDRKDLTAQDASRKPLSAHIEDYRLQLVAKGDGAKHCRHVAATLTRLFEDAGIGGLAEITSDKVRAALGRVVAGGRSARTANHAQGAARAFTRWLKASNRLREDPLALMTAAYKEGADVRYERRDLSPEEAARLIAAAEKGPDYPPPRPGRRRGSAPPIPGAERAMAYRIANGTGFRAGEIASLTPESFDLGPSPSVKVLAAYTKNRREAVQPIRRDLAEILRAWLAGKEPGRPVLALPEKTAKMLRFDLDAAGIPHATKVASRKVGDRAVKVVEGVVDFHSLRATYITRLIEGGASIKTVQELARHSSPNLTIARYTKTDERRKREALDGMPDPELHD